jgi:hypothetical protein
VRQHETVTDGAQRVAQNETVTDYGRNVRQHETVTEDGRNVGQNETVTLVWQLLIVCAQRNITLYSFKHKDTYLTHHFLCHTCSRV